MRTSLERLAATVLLSVVICLSSSCGNSKLARSQASGLIKNSASFKERTWSNTLYFGNRLQSDFGKPQTDARYKLFEADQFKLFESLGYVWSKPVPAAGTTLANIWIMPTKAFTEQSGNSAWKVDPYGRMTPFSVPCCRAELTDITGISQDQKEATAYFTYRWLDTALGERLRKAGWTPAERKEICPQDQSKGAASFTLFDDGWRVSAVAME